MKSRVQTKISFDFIVSIQPVKISFDYIIKSLKSGMTRNHKRNTLALFVASFSFMRESNFNQLFL